MTLKTKHNKSNTINEDGDQNEDEEIKKFQRSKAKEHKTGKRKAPEEDQDDEYQAGNKAGYDKPEGEKPDWKKVKQEKKELKLKRKQVASGGNEVYELGVKAKKIWEEVRREDCDDARKTELSTELYALIKGKAKSIIYAHDTVRVIETLIGVGAEDLKTQLFLELKDDLLNLSKNKYSRFFVLKFLRCGTKEQKNTIIAAMSGHIVELLRHKIACDVLELAYNDYANAKQRSHMIQEFFGPRFRHFKEDDITTLSGAIKKYPDLKDKILADINKALQPILDKGVFTNALVHTLLKEYMHACGEPELRGVIETIKEGLLPILHTRDGARIAMMCLWNSTNKEKKVMLKSFKGNYVKIANEEYGHMVLLAAFDCVDDIVLVSKVVLSELVENLNLLVENDSGKKVLKYLVAPRNKVFFHPHVVSVLQEGDDNKNSKKDRQQKYKEIQKYVSKPILKLVHENVTNWARNSYWTLFVASALQSLSDESIIPIFEAIAEICAEPFIPGEERHFLEVAYISKMVTFIVQCDKERFKEEKPTFSSRLLEIADTEMRGWILSNRGCFVLVNLFETEIPEVVAAVSKLCLPLKAKLQKMSYAGAEVLAKKLQNK